MYRPEISEWLPTTLKEVKARGWSQLDVILFSGDAYIDHPSFGAAVIGRVLESMGLKIAIVPQPNWKDDLRDFKKLGEPRLFFGVSAGVMDSMVNHYTANKRLRSNDAYTAGNISGFRPDYPVKVYTGILKKLFPETPVVIGGVEASLRRFTHYDYWQDEVRRAAAEYQAAAEALSARQLAQVAWPTLPASVLVDEIRRWWDDRRSDWSRRIHGFYRVLGRGLTFSQAQAELGEPTLEGAFVIQQVARVLPAWEAQGLIGPQDLPLMRLLCRCILENEPFSIPWDDLFGPGRVLL